MTRMRRGRTGLMNLTRERYARERMRGTFHAEAEAPVQAPAEPPPLTRGGRSKDPRAYQVLAIVMDTERRQSELHFVTESRSLSEAIQAASRYPFKSVVVSPHSKREFDNGKQIEVEQS